MVKGVEDETIGLAGFGLHGEGTPVPPARQLKLTVLLYPFNGERLPLNTVCWLGKMGPITVPPLGLETEIEKSGKALTTTVPCMTAP